MSRHTEVYICFTSGGAKSKWAITRVLEPRYRTCPSIVAVLSSTHSHVTLFTSEEAVAQAVEQVGAIVDTAAAVFAVARVARVRAVQAARTDIRRAASTTGALADTRSGYCRPCSARSTILRANRRSAQGRTCRQREEQLSYSHYHSIMKEMYHC